MVGASFAAAIFAPLLSDVAYARQANTELSYREIWKKVVVPRAPRGRPWMLLLATPTTGPRMLRAAAVLLVSACAAKVAELRAS